MKIIKYIMKFSSAALLSATLIMASCVSQKKYNAALQDIEDLKVDKAVLEYQVEQAKYEGFETKYEANKDIRASQEKLDSLKSIVQAQRNGFESMSKVLREIKKEGWDIDDLDGKIFITLEDAVFFSSGSGTLTSSGDEMIKDVANALQSDDDLNAQIYVIGHTDKDPYVNSSMDNWDLSAERALSVVRALEKYNIPPYQISAMARSKFDPKVYGNSNYAKSQNRRTEIVLVANGGLSSNLVGLQVDR